MRELIVWKSTWRTAPTQLVKAKSDRVRRTQDETKEADDNR